jgi:Tol biopolymer transport system component
MVITSSSCHRQVDYAPVDAGLTDADPDWSPDGSTIVYCHTHIALIDGDLKPFPESSGFWFVSPDGTNARMLRRHEGGTHLDWSPDGQWLAFSEDRRIWKLKVTGDILEQILSNSTGLNDSPVWSPDGRRIAFNRFQSDGMTGTYTMATNGTDLRFVGYGGGSSWSPDGKRLAYIGYHYIGIRDTNGTNDRKLVTTQSVGNIAFSPDGSKIAFGATIDTIGGLYVIDTTGQNLRLLAKDACLPSWSPDGTKIVYVRRTYERMPGSESITSDALLYIMNADGSGKRQLTFGPDY